MGNTSSTASAVADLAEWHTHPHHHPPPIPPPSDTDRGFTVTPFEPPITVTAITPIIPFTPSALSDEGSAILTRSVAHCTWDWGNDLISSCTSWTETPDIYTLSTPAPYETSSSSSSSSSSSAKKTNSYSFTQAAYTCTDFVCVGSVASSYGYSLCLPTLSSSSSTKHSSLQFGPIPTVSISDPETPTTTRSMGYATETLTCDPGDEDCTVTFTSFGKKTSSSSSSCDTTTTASFKLSVPEATPPKTTESTRRTTTPSSSSSAAKSECDLLDDDDCVPPTPTGRHSSWDWDDPWSVHTARTTIDQDSQQTSNVA
ncbi:hypothetical protein F5Y17DRAFT_415113 [Xylariaceae sp. FL0594]|nr:hypothetical protein F5Y17DRAFT_415113 [Xylariaceae sp. FL0594]